MGFDGRYGKHVRAHAYSFHLILTLMAARSWLQRFLITYTVDLLSVLRGLFDPGLTASSATWGGLQGAYEVYERSGSRQNLHSRIVSNIAPGGHVLNKVGMDGMVRELLVM